MVIVSVILGLKEQQNKADQLPPQSIDFISECSNKIVYTLDSSLDIKPYQDDCQKRGGRFNTCGTVCSEKGEAVITVCALTCEFDK